MRDHEPELQEPTERTDPDIYPGSGQPQRSERSRQLPARYRDELPPVSVPVLLEEEIGEGDRMDDENIHNTLHDSSVAMETDVPHSMTLRPIPLVSFALTTANNLPLCLKSV